MQRLLFSLLFIFFNASAYALDDPWMQIEKASQDMEDLFDKVKDTTTIKDWLKFEVLCNNKQILKCDPLQF